MCDHCHETGRDGAAVAKDVTIFAQTVVRILLKAADVQDKLTALKVVNALLSTGPAKVQVKDWKCPKNEFNRSEICKIWTYIHSLSYIRNAL